MLDSVSFPSNRNTCNKLEPQKSQFNNAANNNCFLKEYERMTECNQSTRIFIR